MKRIPGSFRDPDGYMFEYERELYRAVNLSYKPAYDHLLSSGLYQKLVNLGLMVSFEEMEPSKFAIPGLYKVLKPERIRFISYPYEWAFSMLKDAAILTLEIQRLALEYGMSLKDASAFNVQFQNGKPIFIDTLSFELYPINRPWIAYRQFCQHFLAPLALMARIDHGLNRMFIIHIDGIPLPLAAKMLPYRSRFSLGLYLHIYLHAKAQKKYEHSNILVSGDKRKFSLRTLKALIEGLKVTLQNQRWKPCRTQWNAYTDEGMHPIEYIDFKTRVISGWLDEVKPVTIWDLGANTGHYSRIAVQKGINVISFDLDPACVEKNYSIARKNKETNILSLLLDLLNPSPSLGWGDTERISFSKRAKPDLIMALAIVHHLAISSNIPLELIASQFASLANRLIIEFIPKEDAKVQFLLHNREDIFPNYTHVNFEKIFSEHYKIEQRITSECNQRILYLMTKE